ncbi:MarR family winged helix-turn-helix transcriptional regulator [Pseudoflavonifractor phocaeensis]|mgnify:FL=1|uniref:MarR family winged helix-turn-helix transcriptional regulator n=1 Tax=Pseudoflavonifractor phocaeensis TaxID=1870988 RepID=UPI00195EB4FE|nr:MarR family transcriptional regulator [Pseudoflavonifractor phocaeensis]
MEGLHYLLMKSQALFSRRVLSEISKIGLSSGQPKILDFLLQYGEADQKTIAAHCEIEQTTVGSILLRMESAGLVLRRQKEGNRRSLYVSLTSAGREKAEKLMDIFRGIEADATANLSVQEMETLNRLLSQICIALQEDGRVCV